MRRYGVLLAVTLLLLATGGLWSDVRSEGIRLEPVTRLVTQEPAWAVAAALNRKRIFVADGYSVREFIQLSPGVFVPSIGAPVPVTGRPLAMQAEGLNVYVATEEGIYLVDALQHRVIHSYTGFAAHGLQVEGDHVYVAINDVPDNQCGLYVLDRSLSSVHSLVSECDPGCCDRYSFRFADVAVSSSHAYLVGVISGGFAGIVEGFLMTVDVSQPSQPPFTPWSSLSGFPEAVQVVGGYAYAVEGIEDRYHPWSVPRPGLSIVDVSDPARPLVVGRFETASNLTSVAVSMPFAYATDIRGRVWAVDVSNPVNPTLATLYDTGYPAYDILVDEPYIYVANGGGGLLILRIQTVAQPTPTPTFTMAEGTLTRVEASICQAGETHYLPESGVFLYSEFVYLDPYVGKHVRVWGWSVPSPECELINVTDIEVVTTPTPTLTPTLALTATPTNPPRMRIYLPVIQKSWH
jgi:hypothetical protein